MMKYVMIGVSVFGMLGLYAVFVWFTAKMIGERLTVMDERRIRKISLIGSVVALVLFYGGLLAFAVAQ